MIRNPALGLILALAILSGTGGPSFAGGKNDATKRQVVRIPGTNYDVVTGPSIAGTARSPTDAFLTAIETWLAAEFGLPTVTQHPHVEFVSPEMVAGLAYADGAPARADQARNDVVAAYGNPTKTIYLSEAWTPNTPAELSVLVHELVHHMQNLGGLKYGCPQAREKLAYAAQERWLGLFGRSLARDFGIDPFSLLVKTACGF